MYRKLYSYGAVFLFVSALTFVLVRTVRSQNQTPQEKGDPHSRVLVRLEVLTLHDGLPEIMGASVFSVGSSISKQTSMRKDSTGEVVYLRTIEGQSRWLPDNAIEITLETTENDVKRTETILLEGFEPKTLVLHENPERGRRELLRLIPVSGPNPCS